MTQPSEPQGIEAMIAPTAESVVAGSVYFPPRASMTVGCPHCGEKIQFAPVDGMVTKGKISIPTRFAFKCGWKGLLLNGQWIGK